MKDLLANKIHDCVLKCTLIVIKLLATSVSGSFIKSLVKWDELLPTKSASALRTKQ